VTTPLPVDVTLKYQPQVIIAVSVAGSLTSKMRKNPLSEVSRSYSITLDVLAQLNAKDADLVIHPYVGSAGTFDGSDKQALLDAGVTAATKSLPQIKKLLAEKGIVINAPRMATP
jgi:predicted acylesterase/phospholipase RssA